MHKKRIFWNKIDVWSLILFAAAFCVFITLSFTVVNALESQSDNNAGQQNANVSDKKIKYGLSNLVTNQSLFSKSIVNENSTKDTLSLQAINADLNESYNPIDQGASYLPPIRDQSIYGSGWAFSTIACLEIYMKKNLKYDSTLDLSERHLAYYMWNNKDVEDPLGQFNNTSTSIYGESPIYGDPKKGPCMDAYIDRGSDFSYTTNALMSWYGAVEEAKSPYEALLKNIDEYRNPSLNEYPAPLRYAVLSQPQSIWEGLYPGHSTWPEINDFYKTLLSDFDLNKETTKDPTTYPCIITDNGTVHVQDVNWFPYDPQESTKMNNIKSTISKNGSIAAAYYEDEVSYDEATNSYYCDNATPSQANHAVAVVGWDDNKVVAKCAEPGAWLVRNSWGGGKTYSHESYFWISYYYGGLGDMMCSFVPEIFNIDSESGEATSGYQRNYQYDTVWDSTTTTGLNGVGMQFNVPASTNNTEEREEVLDAVSFRTTSENSKWTIKIFTNTEKFVNENYSTWGDNTKSSAYWTKEELENKGAKIEFEGDVTFEHAGYHTVKLKDIDPSSNIKLTPGEKYVVYFYHTNQQAVDMELCKSITSKEEKDSKGIEQSVTPAKEVHTFFTKADWAEAEQSKLAKWDQYNGTSIDPNVYWHIKAYSNFYEKPQLTSLSIEGSPRTAYWEGETFSKDNLTVYAVYSNSTKKDVTESANLEIDRSELSLEDKVINFKYTEEGNSVSSNLTVEVYSELQDIEISSNWNKNYVTGDSILDNDGLNLIGYLKSKEQVNLNSYATFTADGLEKNKFTKHNTDLSLHISISYKPSKNLPNACYDEFIETVSVKGKLKSLNLVKNPTITDYCVDEPFDPDGIEALAKFDGGREDQNIDVDDLEFEHSGKFTEPKLKGPMTVKYNEVYYTDGKSDLATATFDYRVVPKFESITLNQIIEKCLVGDKFIAKNFVTGNVNCTNDITHDIYATVNWYTVSFSLSDETIFDTHETKKITITITDTVTNRQEIRSSFNVEVIGKITNFIVSGELEKKQYFVGETFSAEGLEAVVEYNGNRETSDNIIESCSFDPSPFKTTGIIPITIKYTENYYDGRSDTFTNTKYSVEIINDEVVSISVETDKDFQWNYKIGDTLDKEHIKVTATYKSGSKFIVSPDSYSVTPDPFNEASDDAQVTISYSGKSVTINNIKVVDWVVDAIVKTHPKITYDYGDIFDASGLVIEATYKSGSKKSVDYNNNKSKFIFAEGTFDPLIQLGLKNIIFSFEDNNTVSNLPIEIKVNDVLDSILLSGNVKTNYYIGDFFDNTNLEITAAYKSSATKSIDKNEVLYSPSLSTQLTINDKKITISYTDNNITVSKDIAINVSDVLLYICIANTPYKTQYFEGEVFDPSGMVVVAQYKSGHSGPIYNYSYSKEPLQFNTTEVAISYYDKTVNQNVSVSQGYAITYDVPENTDNSGNPLFYNPIKGNINLCNPTLDNYVFLGWLDTTDVSLENSNGKRILEINDKFIKDIKLTGIFAPINQPSFTIFPIIQEEDSDIFVRVSASLCCEGFNKEDDIRLIHKNITKNSQDWNDTISLFEFPEDIFDICRLEFFHNNNLIHENFGKMNIEFFIRNQEYSDKNIILSHVHHNKSISSDLLPVVSGHVSAFITDLSDFVFQNEHHISAEEENNSILSDASNFLIAPTWDFAYLYILFLIAIFVFSSVCFVKIYKDEKK